MVSFQFGGFSIIFVGSVGIPSSPSFSLYLHKEKEWKIYCKGSVDISIQTQEKCIQVNCVFYFGALGISVIFFILYLAFIQLNGRVTQYNFKQQPAAASFPSWICQYFLSCPGRWSEHVFEQSFFQHVPPIHSVTTSN